jgi:hypothetical protein
VGLRVFCAYCKKCRVNLGSKSSGWPNVPLLICQSTYPTRIAKEYPTYSSIRPPCAYCSSSGAGGGHRAATVGALWHRRSCRQCTIRASGMRSAGHGAMLPSLLLLALAPSSNPHPRIAAVHRATIAEGITLAVLLKSCDARRPICPKAIALTPRGGRSASGAGGRLQVLQCGVGLG